MTIQEKAQEALEILTDNNARGVTAFTAEAIHEGGELYQKLSDCIEQSDVHEDYLYEWLHTMLLDLADENVEDLEHFIEHWADEFYANPYLAHWLASSNNHFSLVNDMMKEGGFDGSPGLSSILQYAVIRAREDFAECVIDKLDTLASNEE